MAKKKLYRKSDYTRLHDGDSTLSSKTGEGFRSPWRRDYGRIIHSASFRRLQGKTQLFPNQENDFFRNRLTHSLEVAQIAKSIAKKINAENANFQGEGSEINLNIVEAVSLVHDLGHPPFGHNGERALDDKMKSTGGFEGNAQTFRILSRLEKKVTEASDEVGELPDSLTSDGKDIRCGLNLTARILGSTLKYDHEIGYRRDAGDGLEKGYYESERNIVEEVQKNILGSGYESYKKAGRKFKTVECSIMDIADDIAYSTYDFEDALKGGFLNPLDMLAAPNFLVEVVAKKVGERIVKAFPDLKEAEKKFTERNVRETLIDIFRPLYSEIPDLLQSQGINETDEFSKAVATAVLFWKSTKNSSEDGYLRTRLTSNLVSEFISGIQVKYEKDFPAMSSVGLCLPIFKKVEVLKNFTYQAVIMSSRLKLAEHRGQDIVAHIFDALNEGKGYLLMPEDFRRLHKHIDGTEKPRVVCDFIAGMTDKYAMEFYNRLCGANPETIHKPL